LRNGYVETSRTEMIRVMEEFLRERLSSKLKADQFEKYLEKEIKDVMKVISKERKFEIDLGEVKAECFPPCMKEILAELQRGMNIPHTARFALTSFLVNIGMEVDEIIDLFATAPDFDEDKTRYQVEHIAGERGKGVEYSCPNCSTMKTYQNCVKDCRVFHPIEYYKRCKGREKRFKARMVAGEQ
jgi:DNA primase large subunit